MRASISFVRLAHRAAVLMLVLFLATVTYAQITPSDDAYVNSAATTTNYGAATTLDVSSAANTSFIRFDFTAIPAGYTGSSIAKATLKLYVNTLTTAGSFNVDLVNGTWTEKTLKYSTEPALGGTIVASVPLTTASKGTYVEIDITPAVVEWLNNTQPNDGIALVANSPLVATFDSKENTAASHAPEIDIVYAGIAGVSTASGSGLMGGATSGTLNLSLTNACAASQILQWNGTAWMCANLGGGGSVTSVGLTAPSTDFLVTGSPVTGSGTLGLGWLVAPDWNNTAGAIVKRDSSGNFSAGTINAATGFNLGGGPFAFGSYASGNVFLGFLAGNATMTGTYNTASGYQALYSNTTGFSDTASGVNALYSNTTGWDNTASGATALYANTTGFYNTAVGIGSLQYNATGSINTALGYNAGPDRSSTNLSNTTAIGANAVVSESNALVLGGTGSNAVNVGIGTAKPAYTLDVQGSGRFTQPIVFASSQTFPGAGTITGVTAGTDLTGGGTSGNVTLKVDTTKVVTGVMAGTDLTGGGTGGVQTLNLDTTKVPQLAAANTFTGNQTVNGILTATDVSTNTVSASNVNGQYVTGFYVRGTGAVSGAQVTTDTSFDVGGNPFAGGSYSLGNSFLGFAGNLAGGGIDNTASGFQALYSNSGSSNTAIGYHALYANVGDTYYDGWYNTAVGGFALQNNNNDGDEQGYGAAQNTAIGFESLLANTDGSFNTAVGVAALAGNQKGDYLTCIGFNCTASQDGLSNATAIGAHAVVGASNSLVLGGTGKWAVNVGIGTTKPSNILTIAQGAGHPLSDGWATFSSRRWKTNIHTLHGALGKVEQLRGVSYDLKANGQHEVGVIAEEVGAVVPEVVTWEKNGKDAQSVDYGRLTALLIEATKEQQALIQKQQEQIRAQQAQIVQLTRQVKTIQATLKANGGSGSAVHTVKAEATTVRQ